MHKLYNDIIEQVAARHSVIFVDANKAIPKTSEYHRDYVHFTDKGALTLASTIFEVLKNSSQFKNYLGEDSREPYGLQKNVQSNRCSVSVGAAAES